MRVLTLALLFILSCLIMMNWQSDCHKQQQTYLAMSIDDEHTSLQSVLVDGHQQGHILPSSSSLIDPDSNLSKDILGTKTTSRANDHGGVILIGRETFICDVLDTEDSRYKRIAPGLKWIFQKIFFRENLFICPLIFFGSSIIKLKTTSGALRYSLTTIISIHVLNGPQQTPTDPANQLQLNFASPCLTCMNYNCSEPSTLGDTTTQKKGWLPGQATSSVPSSMKCGC